jgi:hypothetical protein
MCEASAKYRLHWVPLSYALGSQRHRGKVLWLRVGHLSQAQTRLHSLFQAKTYSLLSK